MGFFANLTAKLGINTSQFDKGLRAASAAVTRFSKQVAKDFKTTSKGLQVLVIILRYSKMQLIKVTKV